MMPTFLAKQRSISTMAWKNCSKSTVNWKRTKLRNGLKIKCNSTNSRNQETVSRPTLVVNWMKKMHQVKCQLSKLSIWWVTRRSDKMASLRPFLRSLTPMARELSILTKLSTYSGKTRSDWIKRQLKQCFKEMNLRSKNSRLLSTLRVICRDSKISWAPSVRG